MKFALVLIFISALILFAQDTTAPKRTFTAARISGDSPKIDGKLNDAAWKTATYQSGFSQINPVEGAKATEKTEFSILYDDKYLYVAVFCYDSTPDSIEARISRRDSEESNDLIFISFDSYFDKRTAFGFGTNPAGVRMDILFSEDGNQMDINWDPVWITKCSVNNQGWVAEMRIPFSQLRFADKEEQLWGLNLYRVVHRKNEELLWQFVPKDAGGFVSQAGLLKGINSVNSSSRIEILPYAVTSFNTFNVDEDNPFSDGKEWKLNAGLDGKIGISSDLTLDFTVNPDFGQVEADPSEVNLSAFESYFEEKRPFFIEGNNIFQFSLFPGDSDMSAENLFYSRRIGSHPHYYPDSDDGFNTDFVDQPDYTRILGAAKLSGKTNNGLSIGILDAVTNKEIALIDENGAEKEVTVEPLTNYFVSRLQKDYDAGNTSIGGMFTATNRKIEDNHLAFLNKSAYTGGLDFRREWDDKTYALNFRIAGSHIFGSSEAITRLQESSARYFQRPDADYVELDSSRTTLSGHAGYFNIGKISKGHWRFALGASWRSPGIELNDVGFLRKADQAMEYIWIQYQQLNPLGIFRNFRINFNQYMGWNFGGDKIFSGGNINGGAQFLNYWNIHLGFNRQGPAYSPHLLRGGPMIRYMGEFRNWIRISSDNRKELTATFMNFNKQSDDDVSKRHNFNLSINYKLSSQLNVSLTPFYSQKIENMQYISTESFGDEQRYIFGKIDQNTFGMFFRLNYSPTPDLSIQYYGQPFISTGDYKQFKHVDNPMGYNTDRYHIYTSDEIQHNEADEEYLIDENDDGMNDYSFEDSDYNYKQFLSNLVIRWEYMPGSTAYLVWSQTRLNYDNPGQFALNTDLGNLFDTIPDNTFLIKINYWFSL